MEQSGRCCPRPRTDESASGALPQRLSGFCWVTNRSQSVRACSGIAARRPGGAVLPRTTSLVGTTIVLGSARRSAMAASSPLVWIAIASSSSSAASFPCCRTGCATVVRSNKIFTRRDLGSQERAQEWQLVVGDARDRAGRCSGRGGPHEPLATARAERAPTPRCQRVLDAPGARAAGGECLGQQLMRYEHLDPAFDERVGERVVLLAGPLHPQHVVEQEIVLVGRRQPLQLVPRPVEHDSPERADLGVRPLGSGCAPQGVCVGSSD